MASLRQFRDRRPSLMDELNWGLCPAPGVVQNKDGSLMAGWVYDGPDLSSSPDSSMNWLAERANDALLRLGGGWSMWADACRQQTPTYFDPSHSSFPDPISAAVDEERRRHFNSLGRLYETSRALVLQYTPPHRNKGRLINLVYDGGPLEEDLSEAAAILRGFEQAIADFEDSLSGIVKYQRMSDFTVVDEFGEEHRRYGLVNYLNFCLTSEETSINLPPGNCYLDFVLGGMPFTPANEPLVGDKFVSAVAIMGCPDASYPGILAVLDMLSVPYRFSQRFIFMDAPEAEKALKSYEAKWRQRTVGFFSRVFKVPDPRKDEDAEEMADQAKVAFGRTRSARVGTGYYTPVVILHSDTAADARENARIVRREIRRLGFNARVEDINATEAFIGSLPGHSVANVRRPPLHTDNLTHLLPLTGLYQGSKTNPCPFYPPDSPALLQAITVGSSPFYLNFHVGDVGHTLILGPIGAGKSTLLATTIFQALRYPGMHIWAFDLGQALYATTLACGGDHYGIGTDSKLQFCPLARLETDAEVAQAEEYIAILFELQFDRAPAPRQRDEIHRAITRMRIPGISRSLTNFLAEVQDHEVRDAIRPYTLDGPLGMMLDAEHDTLNDGRLICFEIKELMAMGDKLFIPVIVHLCRQFERSLRGQPAMLILDEVWAFLRRQTTREFLREFLKGLRKLNCAVVLATQSLSDAVRSEILDVIMESCLTQIFLPNPAAANEGAEGVPGPASFYRSFGLNEAQIEIIRSATQKRHYYVTSPVGNALIDLQLGPTALAFVGAGSKEDITAVEMFVQRYGKEWPYRWLEKEGVALS